MTPEELARLIEQDEGERIEFKLETEKQADLAETLMAFANGGGGYLLVGVADDGQVVGVESVKTIVDRLRAAARRTEPSLHAVVTLEQAQVDDKTVIVAQVPDDLESTYGLAGRFKIREGSFNRQMSPADVLEHAVRRGTLSYERTPLSQAALDDLNDQKAKDFLTRRLRTSVPERPVEKLLQDMGAAADDGGVLRPTVAGVLFFGNWPQLTLSHTTILAARLIGPRGVRILDRATIEGTLPEQIERAAQFVQRNTRHGLRIGQGGTAQAQEVDEYPAAAIREAITNACCHRDYLERTPIQLKIYDDRLIIGNPGGLLPGLDVEHLEGKHKARNPLLAEWLQTLGYVERFGVGITRMREAMAQVGLPAPVFRNAPDRFEVTLFGPGPVSTVAGIGSESAARPGSSSPLDAGSTAAQPWYKQKWTPQFP